MLKTKQAVVEQEPSNSLDYRDYAVIFLMLVPCTLALFVYPFKDGCSWTDDIYLKSLLIIVFFDMCAFFVFKKKLCFNKFG